MLREETSLKNTADFLGLMAYLALMTGGLPDRELLAFTYAKSAKDASNGRASKRATPKRATARAA